MIYRTIAHFNNSFQRGEEISTLKNFDGFINIKKYGD